ncbi:MAG TPA: hypothetical protein VHQ87_14555 [Rhizobacter sp.]|nr:hypothetical protein [Rhizobacter sp.]
MPAEAVNDQAETLPVDAEGVAPAAEGGERGERDGRRRGRGRGGRDRQRRDENGEAAAQGEETLVSEGMTTAAVVEEAPAVIAAPVVAPAEAVVAAPAEPEVAIEVAAAPSTPAPTPVPAPAPAAPAPAPVAVVAVAPAEAFVLPTAQLVSVAESAGLQWVNSDADKIRAVQEAMAREPKPVHVPREPKPMVAVDEGPLVLVETRKDLSQIKLPFETAQGSQPQA